MALYLQSTGLVLPTEENWREELPPTLKRRTPLIWQLSYIAALRAMKSLNQAPTAIVCATALGTLDETVTFLDKVYDTGFGAPRQFIASVHNSMAGVLAKEFSIKGANMTLCDSNTSLSSAFLTAEALTEETILVIAVDEQIELVQQVAQNCENGSGMLSTPHTGAVAFVITKKQDTHQSTITTTPPKPSTRSITTSESFIAPAIQLEKAVQNNISTIIVTNSITAQATSTISISLAHE